VTGPPTPSQVSTDGPQLRGKSSGLLGNGAQFIGDRLCLVGDDMPDFLNSDCVIRHVRSVGSSI